MGYNQDLAKNLLTSAREEADIADAIGMPTEEDYNILASIFSAYERRRPGEIRRHLNQGRRDYEAGIHHMKKVFSSTGEAVVSTDTNLVYEFELPADLVMVIERAFPTMFRSRKHFNWFKKNFKKLTISGG